MPSGLSLDAIVNISTSHQVFDFVKKASILMIWNYLPFHNLFILCRWAAWSTWRTGASGCCLTRFTTSGTEPSTQAFMTETSFPGIVRQLLLWVTSYTILWYFDQNHLPVKPSYFVIFILSYFYTSPAVVIVNTSYIMLLHSFINGKLTQSERWRPWDNMIAICKLLFHFHLFTRWTAKTQVSQEPRVPWLGNWRSKG